MCDVLMTPQMLHIFIYLLTENQQLVQPSNIRKISWKVETF